MPECDHCGAEFEGHEAYLRHLGEVHEGELGRIEERRVAELGGGDGSGGGFDVPTGPAVLGIVFVFAILLVGYVIFVLGSGGGSAELGPTGSDHEHGTLEMTVLGERVDFSKAEYQVVADRFHFESGDGRVWHAHATGVRLAWGMETLGIGLTEDSVTIAGTTYRDGDPDYDVSITVNGEPVDPETYVLEGVSPGEPPSNGDSVRIEVTRANASE
ncbi:MAG: hypothetical protein V5A43_03800 [Haloarculaceae archaeon]